MSTVAALDWRQARACRDVDSESFFGPRDSEPGERLYRWERLALTVCSVCPVRAACAADALTYPADEQYGVVGGMTASQRRVLLSQTSRRERAA